MRKISEQYTDPFDNILVDISDYFAPYFKKAGFTPNGITTLSLIFELLAIFSLYNQYFSMAAILHLVSFYFDCMDGHFARKYKMISRYGDLYDHLTDIIGGILLITVFFMKNNYKTSTLIIILIIGIILSILCSIHTGCLEVHYSKNKKNKKDKMFLDNFKQFCTKDNATDIMKYTRYVGTGTLTIFICLVIIFAY